jgi:hypothetical protein
VKNIRPGEPVTSHNATNSPLAAVSPGDRVSPIAGRFTDPALWALVLTHGQCSDGGLDPDQWFPVSADPARARQEAAAAIAVCRACPVRGHCLTLSLRHWEIGQHGVWGGLVAAERARLRRRVPAGRATAEPAEPGAVLAGRGIPPSGMMTRSPGRGVLADQGRDVQPVQ